MDAEQGPDLGAPVVDVGVQPDMNMRRAALLNHVELVVVGVDMLAQITLADEDGNPAPGAVEAGENKVSL